MFTEYQIRASFIKALEQALTETGIDINEENPQHWEVMARNQPVMTFGDRTVLIDKISLKRQGFQGKAYHWFEELGEFVEQEQWIEEITWQVSVIRKRLETDDIETITADDVAKKLVYWLNSSHGASAMRGRTDVPFAPVFTSATRTNVYEDDSDNHQAEEQFDFRMIVLQTADRKENKLEGIDWETHPI